VTPARSRYGFEPHEDFSVAGALLGDIVAADCADTFTFGRDGKPFYCNGPGESETRIRWILATLHARCGEGGYHYLVGGPLMGLNDDDGEFDEDWLEDDAEPEVEVEEDDAPEPPAK
jgi:hypothetical protein